jgi:hypothetical protein
MGGPAADRIMIRAKEEYPMKITVSETAMVFHTMRFLRTVYRIAHIMKAVRAIT